MTEPTTDQIILGELRAIRRAQEDMDLRLKVDAIGHRLSHRLTHWLSLARLVPVGVRWCLLAAVAAVAWGAVTRNAKLAALGIDLAFLALLFVGAPE